MTTTTERTPALGAEYDQARRDFNRMRDDGSLPAEDGTANSVGTARSDVNHIVDPDQMVPDPKPEGEAVAWRWRWNDDPDVWYHGPDLPSAGPYINQIVESQPLYAHPAPEPVEGIREKVAFIVRPLVMGLGGKDFRLDELEALVQRQTDAILALQSGERS